MGMPVRPLSLSGHRTFPTLQGVPCAPVQAPAPITCVNTFIFKAAEPRWGLGVADEEGGSRGLRSEERRVGKEC